MEEKREETHSHIGRKGYITRWLILLAIGLIVGAGQVLAEMFIPARFWSALSPILLAFYGLPALAFSLVWTMDRLADAGRDGTWALLLLVPVVNIVALVVFASLPSREDAED